MANWRAITRADVTASLTLKETESYQRSVDFGDDPLPILIERTTAYARLAIRSNGRVRMSPDATTLPVSVISPACDYMIFDILKRIDVEVGGHRLLRPHHKGRSDARRLGRAGKRGHRPQRRAAHIQLAPKGHANGARGLLTTNREPRTTNHEHDRRTDRAH